jgi:hypothetical protein
MIRTHSNISILLTKLPIKEQETRFFKTWFLVLLIYDRPKKIVLIYREKLGITLFITSHYLF